MFTSLKKSLVSKLMVIWSNLHRIRIQFGVTPFAEIDSELDGLVFLKARVRTSLAAKKEVIALPRDNMIFSYVKNFGQWGTTEAKFLTELVIAQKRVNVSQLLMIDLGAHAGLVSKIFLDKLPGEDIQVILVDPLPNNVKAQMHNLQMYSTKVVHCPMAISTSSGMAEFEINPENIGASRLKNSSANSSKIERIQVQTISISDFEVKYLRNNSRYLILKSDLEGIDARILNEFSEAVWHRLIGGVFEIDSTSELDTDEIESLTKKLSPYRMSFSPNMEKELSEENFRSIWRSDQRKVSNLYFAL